MGKHRHPEGYVPPKPVAIFSGSLDSAKRFAADEGLPRDGWTWPRGGDAIRYQPLKAVAVLPDFDQHPQYDLLEPLADLLEHEAGPYVPQAAHRNGRTV
jgi:hypothetical protein